MQYLFGGAALAFVALFVLGAVTRRVTWRGCCSIADPRMDLRMRAAFEDEPARPRSNP